MGGSDTSSPPPVCAHTSLTHLSVISAPSSLHPPHSPCSQIISKGTPTCIQNFIVRPVGVIDKEFYCVDVGPSDFQFLGGSDTSSPPPVCVQLHHSDSLNLISLHLELHSCCNNSHTLYENPCAPDDAAKTRKLTQTVTAQQGEHT